MERPEKALKSTQYSSFYKSSQLLHSVSFIKSCVHLKNKRPYRQSLRYYLMPCKRTLTLNNDDYPPSLHTLPYLGAWWLNFTHAKVLPRFEGTLKKLKIITKRNIHENNQNTLYLMRFGTNVNRLSNGCNINRYWYRLWTRCLCSLWIEATKKNLETPDNKHSLNNAPGDQHEIH